MTGFLPLLKKELREQWRTFRLPGLVVVTLVSAFLSVLTLKYLPQIIEMSAPGMKIEIPEATAPMALAEFSRSVTQIGVIATILMGMGLVARERERGTALLVLTKPVSLNAFVVSKAVAFCLSVAVAIPIATLVTWVYGEWLFPGDIPVRPALAMVALLTMYFLFTAVVTVAYSCVVRSQLLAAGLALLTMLGTGAGSAIPRVGDFLPDGLVRWGNELVVTSQAEPRWGALAVTIAWAALLVAFGVWRLRRSEV